MKRIFNILRKFKPSTQTYSFGDHLSPKYRILFFSDDIGSTFHIYFGSILNQWINEKKPIIARVLTHEQLNLMSASASQKINEEFTTFKPTHVIFCRFAHKLSEFIYSKCQENNCTTLYHLDDNLFAMPEEALDVYKKRHLNQNVISARKFLLSNCHATSFSTKVLQNQILNVLPELKNSFMLPCSYFPSDQKKGKKSKKIGYMGTKSHLNDLAIIKDIVTDFLLYNRDWTFELFGDLNDFRLPKVVQNQVLYREPVKNYSDFKKKLSSFDWQIGFAPLRQHFFNEAKSPIKFVEYTDAGIISILSDFGPYKTIIKNNSAISIDTLTSEKLNEVLNSPNQQELFLLNANKFCKSHHLTATASLYLQRGINISFY